MANRTRNDQFARDQQFREGRAAAARKISDGLASLAQRSVPRGLAAAAVDSARLLDHVMKAWALPQGRGSVYVDALVEREHNRVPRSRTWFRLQQEAAQLEQVEGRDEAAIARVTAAIAETRSLEGTPEARAILMQRLFLDAAVDDAQARAERVSATLERLDAWHGRLGERRTDGERLHAEAIFLVRQDQAAHAFQRLLLSARASARWRGPTDEAWAKELLEFDEGHGDEVGVPVRIAFLTALLNDPAVLDTANPAHALFRQRLTDVLIRIGQTAAAETVEKRSATHVDESGRKSPSPKSKREWRTSIAPTVIYVSSCDWENWRSIC